MATTLRTVSAYQSLLREDDYDLKEAGLKTLLSEVNLHWSDIANDLNEMYNIHVTKRKAVPRPQVPQQAAGCHPISQDLLQPQRL